MSRATISADVTVRNLMAEARRWGSLFLEGGTVLHPHEYADALIYYGRAIAALAAIRNGVDGRTRACKEATALMQQLRTVYNQRYPTRVRFRQSRGAERIRVREENDLPW